MPIDIPIHNLNSSYSINIENISHKNRYDFNTIHRHNYFEILFFEKGGGHQLIDFNEVPIQDQSCYIIKPKQVHLLKRNADADGLLIQFTKEMVFEDSLSILKNYSKSPVIFENSIEKTSYFFSLLQHIVHFKKEKSKFYKEKSKHLLSTILYAIEENSIHQQKNASINQIIINFIDLVDEYINGLTVAEYAQKLSISTKKLSELVKKELNTTPLKYVHDVLVLNIKRDLAFKKLTHKEIAYNYNFDSPSNFSAFIKKQTGLNPTELQKTLTQQA